MIIANRIVHNWLKEQSWYYDYIKHIQDISMSSVARKLARVNKKFLKQRTLYYMLGGACRTTLTSAFSWSHSPEGPNFWSTQNQEFRLYIDKNNYVEESKIKSYKGIYPPWK